jgi:O-antigen/teichoic acid export membrane protein
MPDNLRSKTTTAFGWALGGQLSNQLVSFLISLVLARLLTPEEFGLASLVLVVNLIGQVFLNAGISSGLVRKKEVSRIELSSFFFLNILLGFAIMLSVYFASSLIADLFENADMVILLRLSSLQFFISSFGLMPAVLLKRDINFKFLSQLDIGINIGSGVITIFLAFMGFGVLSLILRSIISSFINVFFLWRKTTWRPSIVFSVNSIKDTLGFSLGVFGLGIVNTVSNNFSTILIGKFFSVSTIGIYNRATSTRGLILKNFGPLFNKVLFPVLSKIQNDEERLKSYYLKAIQMVSLLAVYFMGVLFLFASPLIYYLFGPDWIESAPILRILSIAGLVLPISNINLNLFMVKGHSRFLMSYETIKHIITALVMLICIRYGMNVFLYGLVGTAYLFFITNIILTHRIFKFSLNDQLLAFLNKLFPGILLVIAMYFFLLPSRMDLVDLLFYGSVFSLAYFGFSYLLDQQLFMLIREMLVKQLKRS